MDLRRTLGPAVLLAVLGSCSGHADEVDQAVGELVVCGSGPTVEGIDVSQWQSTVNWPMVRAAGKRFAIARILHWPTRDTQFDRNWREIRANGLIRGAYIYFDPRYEVAAQADIVVRAVGRLGQGDLPVTLDVEQPPPGLPSPTRYAAMVRDLADRIEAGTGRRPMIYTGRYYWPSYVQSTAFRDHPLWHAQYTTTQPCPYIADAWRSWAFWQYSSTGRVSGISGNVDLDRFNGTYAELQRLAGFPAPAVDAGAPRDVPVARDAPAASDAPVVRDVSRRLRDASPSARDVPAASDAPVRARCPRRRSTSVIPALFITGASRGIGLGIALRAARDGANVVIAAKTAAPHPKLPGTIYTAAEEIEAAGGRALACLVDVREEAQVQEAVARPWRASAASTSSSTTPAPSA
jgi:GH25 family lysozyme M1 (1,4-beta-N-acetylmuramidase)